MTKSRVQSAVQEIPSRSGFAQRDTSSMRSVDILGDTPGQSDAVSEEEEFDQALAFLDPEELVDVEEHAEPTEYEPTTELRAEEAASEASIGTEVELPDEYTISFDDAEDEPEASASEVAPETPPEEPGGYIPAVLGGAPFAPRQDPELVEQLLEHLRAPLMAALGDAQRILADPDRVSLWFENQARRRLVSLAERLSKELKATEDKRTLSTPPPEN